MENFIFSLNATLPIFLTMVVGYVIRQLGIVKDPFIKDLNSFNYKITLPFLLFKDISTADFYAEWDTSYVLFCFFGTLICYLLILVGTRLFVKDTTIHGEFLQASYRGSAAVLGIAFIDNIYGSSVIAPLMVLGTVPLYNVLAVITLSVFGPNSTGLTKKTLKKTLIGIAQNPIIWGILLGMIPALLRIQFPVIIQKTVNNVAQLATPLALIGLGASFEGKKALAKIKPTIACTLIRLFIQPMVFLPIAVRMGFTGEKLVGLLIMLGAPTTASCYIMAKNMGHEGSLTSSVVVSTTFFSSVSLTLFLFFMKTLGVI